MCHFFSFCTDPEYHGGQRFYFAWGYRKEHLDEGNDSHLLICEYYGLNEDICNEYEYNPLTRVFAADQINSPVDDRLQAEYWANRLDFKHVVEPLNIKPVINPFELHKVDGITKEQVALLKQWASVWSSVIDSDDISVWASVWSSVVDSVEASVGDSVRDFVRDFVWDSVRDTMRISAWASAKPSVWAFVWDSVRDFIWAYISSFVSATYEYDFTSAVKLWEQGIVASHDMNMWRLHSGKNADVIFEITDDELQNAEYK